MPEIDTHAPQLTPDFLATNPVYLISANMPGCGSSTLAKGIVRKIDEVSANPAHLVEVGAALRAALGVDSEEDFKEKLKHVSDPSEYDPQIYGSIPDDRPCVVDGKLATTAGPLYLHPDRPYVSVNLTSNPVTSSKRIGQREGVPMSETLRDPVGTQFLSRLAILMSRAEHDMGMRAKLRSADAVAEPNSFIIDTSSMCTQEVLEYLTDTVDTPNLQERVPEWELEAIKSTLATIAYLQVTLGDNMHPNDRGHFDYQYQSIRYNAERLTITMDPQGIADIRAQLKKSITDCWFGLMMKQTPRFFEGPNGEIVLDDISHRWTPEYYKIAEGWPILSTKLKDKSILDPFAGPGTLTHLLVARGIPSEAHLSDISYKNGRGLTEEGHTYASHQNSQMTQILFDDLPSWYKPDFSPIKSRSTADSRNLSLSDKSIDYIVTDPPYGKNYTEGSLGLLIGSLSEFGRVAREGSILMIPQEWQRQIEDAGYQVIRLTGDVSRGHSKLPVCYVHILPERRNYKSD